MNWALQSPINDVFLFNLNKNCELFNTKRVNLDIVSIHLYYKTYTYFEFSLSSFVLQVIFFTLLINVFFIYLIADNSKKINQAGVPRVGTTRVRKT